MLMVLLLCVLNTSLLAAPTGGGGDDDGGILDPALYLSPSPPLILTISDITPEQRWSESIENRVERDTFLKVVPLEKKPEATQLVETKHSEPESMTGAETFWPHLRSSYGIQSIHIPLTFAVSGTYGRYGDSGNAGLIGSSYGYIGSGGLYGGSGKSGLAGSSYGSGVQGTRIYGSSSGASWSGWGNGKWGHYGKG